MANNESQLLRKIREEEIKLSEVEERRKRLEAAIGAKYVDEHINDKVFELNYEDELKQAKELIESKEQIEVKILALRGKRKCDCCKSEIELNSLFCNKCGTKLDVIDISSLIGGNICPSCGAIVDMDVNFCTSCGAKMK